MPFIFGARMTSAPRCSTTITSSCGPTPPPRPPEAPSFPVHVTSPVHHAFARGDFREARRLAELMRDGTDAPARDAGVEILRRLAHDPLVPWFIGVAALV